MGGLRNVAGIPSSGRCCRLSAIVALEIQGRGLWTAFSGYSVLRARANILGFAKVLKLSAKHLRSRHHGMRESVSGGGRIGMSIGLNNILVSVGDEIE